MHKDPILPMTLLRTVAIICLLAFLSGSLSSCSLWNKAFGPKYGCKSNGKNVGAERLLSGEKVPKAKKFRS